MGEFSFIGKGQLYIAPYDGSAGFREVGNLSELVLAIEKDEKKLADFTQSGGGNRNVLSRISAVNATMQMTDFFADNLAMAVYGDASAVASGAVTNEVHKAYHGKFIILDKPITPTSIVITDVPGTTTYVLNTDYTVDSRGTIKILSTGSITDGQTVHIDYSYAGFNAVEAIRNSGIEFKAKFVGLNEAKSDKPVVVSIHRMKFSPADNVPLIGDDFANLALTAEALKDTAIVGAGESQYFKVMQVEA